MNETTDAIDQDESPENEALDDETPPAEIRPPKKRKHAKKLKNKQYLEELKGLHVELVKLQQWVIHKGLKVCIVFEGGMAPARAEPSRRSPSGSARGSSASSRCRRRPSARSRRCTSSATCVIFPRREKW